MKGQGIHVYGYSILSGNLHGDRFEIDCDTTLAKTTVFKGMSRGSFVVQRVACINAKTGIDQRCRHSENRFAPDAA